MAVVVAAVHNLRHSHKTLAAAVPVMDQQAAPQQPQEPQTKAVVVAAATYRQQVALPAVLAA